ELYTRGPSSCPAGPAREPPAAGEGGSGPRPRGPGAFRPCGRRGDVVDSGAMSERRVGILVGRERSFPDALIAEVGRREAGVVAEYARVDITLDDAPPVYDVVVD